MTVPMQKKESFGRPLNQARISEDAPGGGRCGGRLQ